MSCDNCCSGRPPKDGKFNNLVVCDKLSNKNLSAQVANIQQLTVGNLTVIGSDTGISGCQFEVPADFPTIAAAIAAAEASGVTVPTVNVCGGIYQENLTINIPMGLIGSGIVLLLGSLTINNPSGIQNFRIQPPTGPGIIFNTGGRPSMENVKVEVGDANALRFVGADSSLNAAACGFQNNSTTTPTVIGIGGFDFRACSILNESDSGPAISMSGDGESRALIGCTMQGSVQNVSILVVLNIDSCFIRNSGTGGTLIAGTIASPGTLHVFNSRTDASVDPLFLAVNALSIIDYANLSSFTGMVATGAGAGTVTNLGPVP